MTALSCAHFRLEYKVKQSKNGKISFPLQVSPINFETQIPFAHKPLQK